LEQKIILNSIECKTKNWYCDGTFAVSPKLFKQLYTINVIVGNKTLPMVYALLPNKSEASYSKMLTFLSEKIISHP
jgi:hypothetical protein